MKLVSWCPSTMEHSLRNERLRFVPLTIVKGGLPASRVEIDAQIRRP